MDKRSNKMSSFERIIRYILNKVVYMVHQKFPTNHVHSGYIWWNRSRSFSHSLAHTHTNSLHSQCGKVNDSIENSTNMLKVDWNEFQYKKHKTRIWKSNNEIPGKNFLTGPISAFILPFFNYTLVCISFIESFTFCWILPYWIEPILYARARVETRIFIEMLSWFLSIILFSFFGPTPLFIYSLLKLQ